MRGFFQDPEAVAFLLLAPPILFVAVAAVLVSMNRAPSSAIAWVLATIFIPLLGAIVCLLVGYSKLPQARRDKQREINDLVLARTEGASSSAKAMTGRSGCTRRWR